MDLNSWFALAGLLLTLSGMMGAMFWKLGANISSEFKALNKAQTDSYHAIDVRLNGIEITVSPYAHDIATLKKQQSENMIRITELKAMEEKIARLERQMEAIQRK